MDIRTGGNAVGIVLIIEILNSNDGIDSCDVFGIQRTGAQLDECPVGATVDADLSAAPALLRCPVHH